MVSVLAPPGVHVWGSSQRRTASATFSRAPRPASYNATYLRPDPRTLKTEPVGRPGYQSVASPFAGSDAASLSVPPAVPAAAYNADYLKGAGKRSYPLGDGPMTAEKAFKVLRETAGEKTKAPVVEAKIYTPADVLETLKLLAKGDLSDEQLEAYEADAGRLRAYAAVAKRRALKAEEQREVDEIGRRLDAEAAALVREDGGFGRERAAELASLEAGLEASRAPLEARKAVALAAAEAADRKQLDADQDAGGWQAEADRAGASAAAVEAKIRDLEDEVANNFPKYPDKRSKDKRRAKVAARLAKLAEDKRRLDDEAFDAVVNKAASEKERDDAVAARDLALHDAAAADADLVSAETELEVAKAAPRRVNERFASRDSKERKQASLVASAIEIGSAANAEEDKKADADFAAVSGPHGPVHEFVEVNLSHRTVDKRFFSSAKLIQEWADYSRKNPKVPASPPWLLAKNRARAVPLVFYSPKVPSEFKLHLLRQAGLI